MNGQNPVQIKHPVSGHPVVMEEDFWIIASGRADNSIVSVVAQIVLTGEKLPPLMPQTVVPSKTLPRPVSRPWRKPPEKPIYAVLPLYQVAKNGQSFQRWCIKISLPDKGVYSLTVVGFDNQFKTYRDRCDGIQLHKHVNKGLSTVSWPADSESLDLYKDDFVPYGTLDTGDALTSIILSDTADQAGNTSHVANSVGIANYDTEGCWTAEMESIPQDPNYYTLNGSFQLSTFTPVTMLTQRS